MSAVRVTYNEWSRRRLRGFALHLCRVEKDSVKEVGIQTILTMAALDRKLTSTGGDRLALERELKSRARDHVRLERELMSRARHRIRRERELESRARVYRWKHWQSTERRTSLHGW